MKMIAESCPNIEHLDLSKWLDQKVGKLEFDDVGLVAIANACGHLVNVNLSGRLGFREIGIGSLVRSCKKLTTLIIGNCVTVTDKSLKMIREATRLEKLDLQGCYMISNLGLEYLANGKLKHCLETLYLNSCDRITDNGIIHLKKLASLRTLGLSRCGANITDYGVVALCELPNLEILHLDFLINITDISLLEIGRKCLNLLWINLSGCQTITSVGLRCFFGHQRLSKLFFGEKVLFMLSLSCSASKLEAVVAALSILSSHSLMTVSSDTKGIGSEAVVDVCWGSVGFTKPSPTSA
ncbi:leucine-rich repeat, cysteine-containing subtype protein [Tanacetum coccineum]|uniref:Leucine-rich repeat, cysteine-containing subtype protein n=1 Tax=Tanacetum coccineum TaxID=301880 RepID=A0ABQ5E5L5_9ASTR